MVLNGYEKKIIGLKIGKHSFCWADRQTDNQMQQHTLQYIGLRIATRGKNRSSSWAARVDVDALNIITSSSSDSQNFETEDMVDSASTDAHSHSSETSAEKRIA